MRKITNALEKFERKFQRSDRFVKKAGEGSSVEGARIEAPKAEKCLFPTGGKVCLCREDLPLPIMYFFSFKNRAC